MKIHPHDLLLQELLTSPTDEHEEIIDHLVECTDCQKRLEALTQSGASPSTRRLILLGRRSSNLLDYDPALDRAVSSLKRLEAAYARERSEAAILFSELKPHPAERWRLIIHNSSRFQTWGLCDYLLQQCREKSPEDGALGADLAQLALELADLLDPELYGEERIEDLKARAWGGLGNIFRLRFDLTGAEVAFGHAFEHLRRGTQEPFERAQLLDLRASLLRAQGRFEASLSSLRRAVAIYLQAGERNRAGRALVKMSISYHAMAEPENSMAVLHQALELIDPDREPRLLLCAWHNLIDDLAETGQFMKAQLLLARARPLYERFPQPFLQNPRQWVEGKIAHGLGWTQRAEDLLLTARNGFLAESAYYDAAVVSLDLAILYAEQGRIAEQKQLAEEMISIFSSQRIHREALAALAFWKQAAESEQAHLDVALSMSRYLRRAQANPSLRFEVPE